MKLNEEEEEDGTREHPLPYNHVPLPASHEGSASVIAHLRGGSSGGTSWYSQVSREERKRERNAEGDRG